jgi:hypothetical protein
MTQGIILEKDGNKLLEDRIVSKDKKEYFIKEMKQASLIEKKSFGGLVGGYYLSIEFLNGERKDFWFNHRLSTKQVFAASFSKPRIGNWEVVNATERERSIIILEWVDKINMLINNQKP